MSGNDNRQKRLSSVVLKQGLLSQAVTVIDGAIAM